MICTKNFLSDEEAEREKERKCNNLIWRGNQKKKKNL